jgi:serine/threonine-protein kinase
LYGTSARFCAEAFAARPELAADLRANRRYNAACMAARAGCGQGADAARFDDRQRARWRQQALDWLRAELALLDRELGRNPSQARMIVQVALPHWQHDADLGCVRDGAALARLPEAESGPWQKLWADVAALLDRARGD